jgi:hypothetical protein
LSEEQKEEPVALERGKGRRKVVRESVETK